MRTSLSKLQEIEQYLLCKSGNEYRLVFEARMIIDPDLEQDVSLQKDTYLMIHKYGRQQLKTELEAVYKQLLTQPKYHLFRQKVTALFK